MKSWGMPVVRDGDVNVGCGGPRRASCHGTGVSSLGGPGVRQSVFDGWAWSCVGEPAGENVAE